VPGSTCCSAEPTRRGGGRSGCGPLAVVDAVLLVAVEGVFEGVDVGDVDARESPGDEFMELVGGVWV
jgi:hypothetical protein